MLSPASPYRVRVGQRITMECVAEGDPLPTVQWEMPSQPTGVGAAVPERQERGSAVLEIASVTQQHQGVYVCVANNGLGRTEGRMQLISMYNLKF